MKKNQRVKVSSVVMSLALGGIMLCGCNTNAKPQDGASDSGNGIEIATQENTTKEEVTEGTTEATSEAEKHEEITKEELTRLFEENLNCMLYIFELGELEHEEEPIDGDMIYRVTDDKFQSFADLEEYVRSVYAKEEADRLLYHYPYEDQAKYIEQDGALCINLALSGGKGYYVDWTDFEVEMELIEADRCTFQVIGTIEEPADEPVQEEYIAKGVAVYEDGHWVLEEMMH